MEKEQDREVFRWGPGEGILLGGVLLLALVVRVVASLSSDMYVDECFAFYLARLPASSIISFAMTDSNPPLYYFIIKPILYFTRNTLFLRLPSVIFSLASIYLTYLTARLVSGRKAAFLAALFCATAYSCWAAQSQVRMYGLAVFLASLCAYLLVGMVEQPGTYGRRKYVIALAGTCLVLPHVHYTLILPVIAAIFAAVLLLEPALKRKLLVWLALSLVIFASWHGVINASRKNLYLHVSQNRGGHARSLLPGALEMSTLPAYVTGIDIPLGWRGIRERVKSPGAAAGLNAARHAGGIFFFVLAALGFAGLCRGRQKAALVLGIMLALPVASIAIVSLLGFPISYQHRYNVFVFPLFFIFLARFLAQRQGMMRAACLALAGGLALIGAYTGLWEFPRDSYFWYQDWQSVARFVERNGEPGDVIAAYIPYSLMGLSRTYMIDGAGWSFDAQKRRIGMEYKEGYFQDGGLRQVPLSRTDPGGSLRGAGGTGRVILILSQDSADDREGRVRKYFSENYAVIRGLVIDSYTTIGRTEVYLLSPLPQRDPGS